MSQAIAPGARIGIVGGGQLGLMAALAARAMGYRVGVLDPDPRCAARPLADLFVAAPLDDVGGALELARRCAVITAEIEKVPYPVLAAMAEKVPVRPSPEVLRIVQDRLRQKQWLARHGFPTGPYQAAKSAAQLATALTRLGGDCFIKVAAGGYDGRGQIRVGPGAADAISLWRELGATACVVERALPLRAEISVLAARRPSGEIAIFPPALNHHRRRILDWAVLPAPIHPDLLDRARAIALAMANTFHLEGLLAIEMFIRSDRTLLVNELAPRPHNSYHASEIACQTSQFEQLIRAICNLPLGGTGIVRPAAIKNLFGQRWAKSEDPPFDHSLRDPQVKLRLYGKRPLRPDRKMGHLLAAGDSPRDALARVERAAGAANKSVFP